MCHSLPLLIALHLVLLHTVDGREVLVNPEQVTSIQAHKEGEENKVLVDTVQCVVGFTNGKFVSVVEHCDKVKQLLEDTK